MSLSTGGRMVNPRLGSYFGIFASVFLAVFLLALILGQLGVDDKILSFAVLLTPMALYGALAAASFTNRSSDFLASGRRVPSVYNGAALVAATMGGFTVASLTGLFYAHGFDAWAIATGTAAGLVIMGTMVAPYVRKDGALSLPGFLGRRFDSRAVRLTAAAIFLVPIFLVLVAELRIGVWLTRQLTGSNERWLLAAFSGTAACCLLLGGARATSWSATAQTIAVLLSVVGAVGVAATVMTNLPVAQLSFGPVLQDVARAEAALGVPKIEAQPIDFAFAKQGLVAITERMGDPFTAIGYLAHVLLVLMVMAGIAAAPWIVPRCAMATGVHAARKSLSWAILAYTLIAITLAAAAAFVRWIVLSDVAGRSASAAPDWFQEAASRGLAEVTSNVPSIPPSAVQLHRDAIVFLLPNAAELPHALTFLVYAGAAAAVVGCVTATAYAMSTILSEDVVLGMRWEPPSPAVRLSLARLAVGLVLTLASLASSIVATDPVTLVLMALALSAATAFPVTLLAIWYKRMTTAGTAAALVSGFVTCLAVLLSDSSGGLGFATILAGVAGLCVAALCGITVSRFTVSANRIALERVRDMRIPGGETIYDREIRLLRQKENSV